MGLGAQAYDGSSAIGGVHAGYRYDFGRAVVGVDLAYDMTNIDIGDAGDELNNVATLKLMAGGKIGQGLLYATADGSWPDVTSDAGNPGDGIVYGVGYDHMLNDRWSVGAELLRYSWDTFDDAGTDADATRCRRRLDFDPDC